MRRSSPRGWIALFGVFGCVLTLTTVANPAVGATTGSARVSHVSDALLPKVALGDADAMQACLTRYAGLVWGLARRLSSSETEAEDAVQEIFLDLWKSAHRFDAAHGTELGFVAVIARRRLIDRRRAQRRLPATEQAEHAEHLPPSSGGVRRVEAKAEVALAARALDALSEEQREVLLLSAVQGLSHEEIAAVRGMALGTVKSHARRALQTLRSLLEDDRAAARGLSPGGAS